MAMCFHNTHIAVCIDMNDMLFDGIVIYDVSKSVILDEAFASQPIHEKYFESLCQSTQYTDYHKTIEALGCENNHENTNFADIIAMLHQQKMFVGVDSIYQDDIVMDLGYIDSVTDTEVLVHCVNTDGAVDDSPYAIELAKITNITINSNYLNAYQAFIDDAVE